MKTIIGMLATFIGGFALGVIEENVRYSIIHHEAKKGDAESQQIIDEFDKVGTRIEEMFSK